MTIASLLLGTAAFELLFIFTKVIFLHYLNMDSVVIVVAYFVAIVIVTVAVVRRMGVLNYVEAFFLCLLWILVTLALDFLITATLISRDFFSLWNYWLSYLVFVIALILFHKKLHLQVRRAAAEKAK
jgi:hypothetical protein